MGTLRIPCMAVFLSLVPALAFASSGESGRDIDPRELLRQPMPRIHVASPAVIISGEEWFLPYRGSLGGFSDEVSCGLNAVAVGLHGRTGTLIHQVGLICSSIYFNGNLGPRWTTSTMGGPGGGYFYRACPAGQVLVGVSGRSSEYIDQLGIMCAPLDDWSSRGLVRYWSYAGGGTGGTFFYDACPMGYVITRILGRAEAYLIAQQAVCTYVSP